MNMAAVPETSALAHFRASASRLFAAGLWLHRRNIGGVTDLAFSVPTDHAHPSLILSHPTEAPLCRDELGQAIGALPGSAADKIVLTTGKASIVMKKNGDILIQGNNILVDGSGKISVNASGSIILKGQQIGQN